MCQKRHWSLSAKAGQDRARQEASSKARGVKALLIEVEEDGTHIFQGEPGSSGDKQIMVILEEDKKNTSRESYQKYGPYNCSSARC